MTKPTLKNHPKPIDDRPTVDELKYCQWFEDFEKRHKHIAEFPTKWLTDNKAAIMKRFHHHSVSGLTPEELLVFFIEKEVLGVE